MVLSDNCGRPLLNLRIAITQRCNLSCAYCHREGEEKQDSAEAEEMAVDEIARIARTAVSLGISRIKLTGGEPLMRADICEIVRRVAAIPNLKDLSLTTNGAMLAPIANDLRACGLKRVNISLPTLNPEKYEKLTHGKIKDALEGIRAAVEAGFCPVKLNMVILSRVNAEDVPEMMDFSRRNGTILQLIELDPVNVDHSYYSSHHKSLDEYEEMLGKKALTIETRRYMQSRRIYRLQDATVEVVHPIENSEFCMHCTRLRLTSDGKLKACLMRNDNLVDVLTPLRNGASDEELTELFVKANQKREPYIKSS